jgi:serine/threonine protein kinase
LAAQDERVDPPSRKTSEKEFGDGEADESPFPVVKSALELVLEKACSVTGLTHQQMIDAAKSTKGLRGVTFCEQTPTSAHFRMAYKTGKTLGRGAFSTVKLATNRRTKEQFAVKIMNTGPSGKASLINAKQELSILRQLDHESIMKVEAAFTEAHKTYFVTEYLPGGLAFCISHTPPNSPTYLWTRRINSSDLFYILKGEDYGCDGAFAVNRQVGSFFNRL